jgi:hypothetical protein
MSSPIVYYQVCKNSMAYVDINEVKQEPSDSPHEQRHMLLDSATWSDVTDDHKVEPSEDCDYKSDANTYLVKGYQCPSHPAAVEPDQQIPIHAGDTGTAVNPSCSEQPYPVLLIKVKTEPTEDLGGWSAVTDYVAHGQTVGRRVGDVIDVKHDCPILKLRGFTDSTHTWILTLTIKIPKSN